MGHGRTTYGNELIAASIRHAADDGIESAVALRRLHAEPEHDALHAAGDERRSRRGIDGCVEECLGQRIAIPMCPMHREGWGKLDDEGIDVSARGQIHERAAEWQGLHEISADDDIVQRIDADARAHLNAVRQERKGRRDGAAVRFQRRNDDVPEVRPIIARVIESAKREFSAKCTKYGDIAPSCVHVRNRDISGISEFIVPLRSSVGGGVFRDQCVHSAFRHENGTSADRDRVREISCGIKRAIGRDRNRVDRFVAGSRPRFAPDERPGGRVSSDKPIESAVGHDEIVSKINGCIEFAADVHVSGGIDLDAFDFRVARRTEILGESKVSGRIKRSQKAERRRSRCF